MNEEHNQNQTEREWKRYSTNSRLREKSTKIPTEKESDGIPTERESEKEPINFQQRRRIKAPGEEIPLALQFLIEEDGACSVAQHAIQRKEAQSMTARKDDDQQRNPDREIIKARGKEIPLALQFLIKKGQARLASNPKVRSSNQVKKRDENSFNKSDRNCSNGYRPKEDMRTSNQW